MSEPLVDVLMSVCQVQIAYSKPKDLFFVHTLLTGPDQKTEDQHVHGPFATLAEAFAFVGDFAHQGKATYEAVNESLQGPPS
jgi:hypothetical protein